MFDSIEDDGLDVRAERYLIARTVGLCPHCRGETSLVGLVVPPGHETLSIGDEEAAGIGPVAGGSWERTPRHALLFYVELLPNAVRQRLQALAPAYRLARSPATQGSYWANHCERCGGFQEDHELFCELEGAFLPISRDSGAAIELMPVEEPIRAGAAGYALDPEFLGCPAPL
jgi:hypothetical protein